MDKFLKRKPHDEINSESITKTEEIVQTNQLRKYDVEHIRFGFIGRVSNANRPQCLLCHKLLKILFVKYWQLVTVISSMMLYLEIAPNAG